ncbi:MAG: GNAT family N-acetyltransferase [Planctomycetes bacterium]|nr:GNAT family N-acetyltransferase [Planctomycetota bacterium]
MKGNGKRALLSRAWRRLANVFNQTFRKRNHVYVFDALAPAPAPVELHVERYVDVEDVPSRVPEALRNYARRSPWEGDVEELRMGAVYWVGYDEGEVACTCMSRRGIQFRRWFVPLEPSDLVIIRGRTLPALRGRGLFPALMREIVRRELRAGGRAYADCRVYNSASMRAIEKAGFRRIATLKALTRREALG